MASAHFQVVEQLGLRTPNLGEPYYQGKVLLRDGDIRNLSLEEGLDPKTMQILLGLHENEQCLVTRANLGPTSIRVLKTSKIFTDVLPFTPDHSVLEIYKNPPLVSISDILKSPRKRRVSLEANIVTVSPVKNKKRDLKVLNQDEEVLVKLWFYDVNTLTMSEQLNSGEAHATFCAASNPAFIFLLKTSFKCDSKGPLLRTITKDY